MLLTGSYQPLYAVGRVRVPLLKMVVLLIQKVVTKISWVVASFHPLRI